MFAFGHRVPDHRVRLNDHPMGNGWAVDGDTRFGALNNMRGTCDGGEGYQVYEFVAPEAGRYILNADGTDFTPLSPAVMYVRTMCGIPESETHCEVGDFNRGPSLGMELDANELIYIFIDGQANENFENTGTFELVVAQHSPWTIEEADAWFNRGTGSTAELRGIKGPMALGGMDFRIWMRMVSPSPFSAGLGRSRMASMFSIQTDPMAARTSWAPSHSIATSQMPNQPACEACG